MPNDNRIYRVAIEYHSGVSDVLYLSQESPPSAEQLTAQLCLRHVLFKHYTYSFDVVPPEQRRRGLGTDSRQERLVMLIRADDDVVGDVREIVPIQHEDW